MAATKLSLRLIGAAVMLWGTAAHAVPPRVLADSYQARQSDSLVDLAVDLDLGYLELVAANPGVDPWLPGAGTEVRLPNIHLPPDVPHKGVVVNIGDQRVYYFAGKDQPVESWPIGIGREGFDIPLQRFTITAKRKNPTWVPPPSVRAEKPDLPPSIGPGPDNPLGDYALNLGSSLYRIHGTNLPYGVGRRVSSGCIRMYPADIETLFNKVSIGTPVAVINQPAKLGWIDGELYLEVHPAGDQLDQLEETFDFDPRLDEAFEEQVARVAGEEVDRVDWAAVVQTWAHRTGLPVRITRVAGEDTLLDPLGPISEAATPPVAQADRSGRPSPAEAHLFRNDPYEKDWRRDRAEAPQDRSTSPIPLSRPQDRTAPGAGVW